MAFTDEEILEEFVGACNRAPRRELFLAEHGYLYVGERSEATAANTTPRDAKRAYALLKNSPTRSFLRKEWRRANRELIQKHCRGWYARLKLDPAKYEAYKAKNRARTAARKAAIKADPAKHALELEKERKRARKAGGAKKRVRNAKYYRALKADPKKYAAYLEKRGRKNKLKATPSLTPKDP